MTDEERTKIQRDTVARIHATRGERLWHGGGKHPTTRARVAARYAALCQVTIATAARTIGAHRTDVGRAWRAIYPGVPVPRAR